MIRLKENKDCCGCHGCVQRCPRSCITMQEDIEGFLYPVIDLSLCIDCGICEKVCPVIHQGNSREPLAVYAAKNKNEEIRKQSSSGGIFTLLAEQTINQGGVVFGACFNEVWEVVHNYTETIEGLAVFRGSKYVQSRIGDTYRQAESFLKAQRKVLFSGTPCQIAGLKCYLRKEYENLLTVDFICHGVPSPKVWRMYLDELIARQDMAGKSTVLSHLKARSFIQSISFRNKYYGWKRFSFVLTFSNPIGEKVNTFSFSETLDKNLFMRGFLRDLYLRPSCHACPSRCFKSGSDITIGDFWGIDAILSDYDDDKGISAILIHDDHVVKQLDYLNIDKIKVELNQILKGNSSVFKNVSPNKKRASFFAQLNTKNYLSTIIKKQTELTIKTRFVIRVYNIKIIRSLYKLIKTPRS